MEGRQKSVDINFLHSICNVGRIYTFFYLFVDKFHVIVPVISIHPTVVPRAQVLSLSHVPVKQTNYCKKR